MASKESLEERRRRKAKKPSFRRQDAHKKREVARSGYRRPKGLQSKMRLGHRGYVRTVSTGFGSPRAAAGLTRDGRVPVPVATARELAAVDAATQCAVLAAGLGAKRKEELLTLAKEKSVPVLNAPDIDKALAALKGRLDARRAAKAERLAKAKKPKKTIDEKVAAPDAKSDDEKRQAEEDEKRKVLTKRQ